MLVSRAVQHGRVNVRVKTQKVSSRVQRHHGSGLAAGQLVFYQLAPGTPRRLIDTAMQATVVFEIHTQPLWDCVHLMRDRVRGQKPIQMLRKEHRPLGVAATAQAATLTRKRNYFRMPAILTDRPGTAVQQDAAVEVFIQRLQYFVAQRAVLRLELLGPAPLQFVTVVIYQPVKRRVFRGSSPVTPQRLGYSVKLATYYLFDKTQAKFPPCNPEYRNYVTTGDTIGIARKSHHW